MRKRKLITQLTMEAMRLDLDRGVPLARAMRNHDIAMSRPAVAKLMQQYQAIVRDDDVRAITEASLFPGWLTEDEQEEPGTVCYDGFFPFGEWITKE